MNPPPKKSLFGIGITDATEEKILEYIFNTANKRHDSYYIVTPNPEIIIYARKHPEFRAVLNKAELALCDGIGLWLAGKLLGKSIQARVTGTDMVYSVCRNAALLSFDSQKKPVSVGFLGAGDGVALKAAERLMLEYSELEVVFAGSEWDQRGFADARDLKISQKSRMSDNVAGRVDYENASDGSPAFHDDENSSNRHIDILFVAYGFPKQELWMAEQTGKLSATVLMGVGGAFDYISGGVPRAPSFMRSLGLEWLFRLIRQPWRAQRQTALIGFSVLVLKEYFRQLLRRI